MIGDVLTQRVALDQAGRGVEPTALPAADRVGPFLERRTPRIERDASGRRWLVIDYQVINAPRALTVAALPALTIGTTGGVPLRLAAWPISIGPLAPAAAFGQGDLLALRPERAVEPLPTGAIERQLHVALAALAVLASAWTAWWATRNWREARRLPFGRAWQQVRRSGDSDPAAWRAVHHALNATAGRAVQGATLARLLADAPHLRPLAARLEAFFVQSGQRFFAVETSTRAGSGPGTSAGTSSGASAGTSAGPGVAPFALRELSAALRDAERRQAR